MPSRSHISVSSSTTDAVSIVAYNDNNNMNLYSAALQCCPGCLLITNVTYSKTKTVQWKQYYSDNETVKQSGSRECSFDRETVTLKSPSKRTCLMDVRQCSRSDMTAQNVGCRSVIRFTASKSLSSAGWDTTNHSDTSTCYTIGAQPPLNLNAGFAPYIGGESSI